MKAMKIWLSLLLVSTIYPCAVECQTRDAQLPAHSVLSLQLTNPAPLRVGQPVCAELVYPVYLGESLVIPEHALVTGTVIALRPDRSRRIRSRFNLDFTPFRIPVVRFTQITLAGGATLPIETSAVSDSATVVHFARPRSGKQKNFIRREFDSAIHLVGDETVFFTARGRGDRLRELLYHQLPWHPQRIEKGTTWAVETEKPFTIPLPVTPEVVLAAGPDADSSKNHLVSSMIEATLSDAISSATAKPGQTVRATVATPVFNDDHTLAIPQGAILIGTVSQTQPSRGFGRSGTLRFAFHQIVLPSGKEQNVTSNLVGGDSASQHELEVDSEGAVMPKPQEKFIVPILLLGLAAAPLDPDPGDSDEFVKNGAASNSLGLPGFITGIAVNSMKVSSAFGFYAASLSIYDRWIKRGTEVNFPRYTRVTLQTDIHTARYVGRETDPPQPKQEVVQY
jgi:hypothetical protein